MTTLEIAIITDRAAWNNALAALALAAPNAHILQTWEWGELKRMTTGWQPIRFAYKRDGQIAALASVGVRTAFRLFKVMYVPKGPVLAYADAALLGAVLEHLEMFARRQGAVWLKIDPDVIDGTGIPGQPDEQPDTVGGAVKALLHQRRWQFSPDQVQFRNTLVIDLARSTDQLLAAMSQNTRRKVRAAEREGVTIRVGSAADLPLLYDLYRVTGERDHFLIRPFSYYELAWKTFMEAGLAHPLIAEKDGVPIAMVILFHFGATCWYFYGASSNQHRDAMPNYLLQWHAMQWAKAHGYTLYDLWGAPNTFDETDSMWGVFMFKQGFRGQVVRHIGAWDYAPYPPLYALYTQVMPRLLRRMRAARGAAVENHDESTG
ncbi:MAG: peptidoglycan bridge formation glycyltransferase FemA/FemB family protein [bacterium]|nr:peptidoglycan bridge formation glycyltransferase FemA/FemB family protein [bacterium]